MFMDLLFRKTEHNYVPISLLKKRKITAAVKRIAMLMHLPALGNNCFKSMIVSCNSLIQKIIIFPASSDFVDSELFNFEDYFHEQ